MSEITKREVEDILGAWYDHKMDPGDADLKTNFDKGLEILRTKLEEASGNSVRLVDVKNVLRPRFRKYLEERGLPKPPET